MRKERKRAEDGLRVGWMRRKKKEREREPVDLFSQVDSRFSVTLDVFWHLVGLNVGLRLGLWFRI